VSKKVLGKTRIVSLPGGDGLRNEEFSKDLSVESYKADEYREVGVSIENFRSETDEIRMSKGSQRGATASQPEIRYRNVQWVREGEIRELISMQMQPIQPVGVRTRMDGKHPQQGKGASVLPVKTG